MGISRKVRWALVFALVLVAAAPAVAAACVNDWGMKAVPGDGTVALTWGALPAGSTAKLVRSTGGWASDPGVGGLAVVGLPYLPPVSAETTVVYLGAGASFTDTGLANGVTYWYTLFVKDDATGTYSEKKSEVVATPGVPTTVSQPKVSTPYVVAKSSFGVSGRLGAVHDEPTRVQVVLSRKVDGRWVYVKSGSYAVPADTAAYRARFAVPSRGSWKLVVKHDDAEHLPAHSAPRFFYAR